MSSPFGAAVFTPLPGTPTIIAGPGGANGQPLLDLNGDGTGDMIVQYSGNSGVAGYRDVSALLTHADGTAAEYRIARYAAPDLIDQVVVTDLNHDGHSDVVVMHTDPLGETVLDVFMGQSDGTFTQPNPSINLGTLTGTPALSIFDATGDHVPDLFLQLNAIKVTVYPGNGDGTFATPATTTFPLIPPTSTMSFQTDVTGDGIPDVVMSGMVLSGVTEVPGLAVFKGTSTGAFNTTPVFSDYTDNLNFLALRNLSSSALPDIVAFSTPENFQDQPGPVMVFKNNGNGTFTKDFTSATLTSGFDSQVDEGGTQYIPLLTPALTHSGRNDLLLFEGGIFSPILTVHVEINNGNGFTNTQNFTMSNFASNSPVVVADVDGDGLPDLVLGQNGSQGATVFFNNGSGGFVTPGVQLAPTSANPLFIAAQVRVLDLNNDGKMDVVFTSFPTVGPNSADVYLNQTGRTFGPDIFTPQSTTLLLQADSNTHMPADPALDYNGDGQPDFLGYASNGPSIGPSEGFSLLTLSASGGFMTLTPPITFGATVTVPENPTPADINNDGKTDLVFAAPADGQNNSPGIYIVMNGSAVPVSSGGTSQAGATDLGTITAPAAFDEFMTATGAGGQSFFKFTLAGPQHIRITISPDAGDIASMLLRDTSNNIQSATVGLAPTGPQGSFFYEWDLAAGTYVLEVDHGQGADTHYRLDIAVPPAAQSIAIQQGFTTLPSGMASPIDFGAVKVTTTDTQKFFTVRNDGQSTLTFSGMQLPAGFLAGEDALPATLAPGAQATFSVQMNANATGVFSGNVVLLSNDPNTPQFDLPVAGTVTGTPLSPGISVKEGTLTLTSGQGAPVDFPTVAQGATSPTLTFTVKNTGTETLTLGTPNFPANFLPGSDTLVNSLAPGASDTFTVQELTVVGGVYSGNISIPTSAATNPFLIPVEATISTVAAAAVITGNGQAVLNNAATTSASNATYFGSVPQGASAVETFTISNAGTLPLTIGQTAATGGFTVVSPPTGTVAPHSSTTFKIGLPTLNVGDYSGTVSFTTNDPNNTSFSFAVAGTVTSAAPTIGDFLTNGTVAQGLMLTLTAQNVAAVAGASIKSVKFYVDSSATGIFDPHHDALLGTGKAPRGSNDYVLNLNAGNLPVGAAGAFAVVTDSKGRMVVASSSYDITPYNAPSIGSAAVSPGTSPRGQKVTLTATNVTVSGDAISKVTFYLGVPGDDGDFSPANDVLLGTGKLTSSSAHTYTLATKVALSQSLATYPVYAVATSKHNHTTVANADDLTVTDVPPVIKSISLAPAKVAADNNVSIRFNSVTDVDGSVAHVNVYWSPGGATDSTAAALLLGQATLAKGAWTFTGRLPKSDDPDHPFPTSGTAVFLAQAVDNNGVAGNIVSAAAPVVPQLTISGTETITPTPVVQGQSVTLTVTGVNGSPRTVQFVLQNGSQNSVDALAGVVLGNAKQTAPGTWTLVLKNALHIPPGDETIFARAEDSNGNFSEADSQTVTVT